MKDLLQFILEGGRVERYHTRPGIRPDTNAQHSHGVAVLCSILAGVDEQGRTLARSYLLMAALTHDLAEQATSDVSAPAKRALNLSDMLTKLEQGKLETYGLNYEQWLSEDEKIILKLADSFDGMLWCCHELALGNRRALLIWRRWCSYIEALETTSDLPLEIALRASQVYEAIKDVYKEYIGVGGPDFDVFESK